MLPVISLLAASAVSISAGWTRLPTGGYEYIIQIEPEAIATLVDGEEFTSDVPPEARDVRSYRVRVGRGKLPRESSGQPITLDPPPADATLPLDPPPKLGAPAPNEIAGQSGATTPPPGAYPPSAYPNADPRHVGIHADNTPGAADKARVDAGYEPEKAGEFPAATKAPPPAGPPAAGPSATGEKAGGVGDAGPPVKALWAPLFGALLALFASVGGNVFLGWTAVSMRGRYRALLAHQQMA